MVVISLMSAQTAELKNQSWKNLGRPGIWTWVNWVRSTNATYLTSIIFFKWWIKLCLSSAHQSVWVKSKKFRHLIFFQLAYDCLGSTKFVPIFYRSFKIPSYVKVQPLFCRSEANGYQKLFSFQASIKNKGISKPDNVLTMNIEPRRHAWSFLFNSCDTIRWAQFFINLHLCLKTNNMFQ